MAEVAAGVGLAWARRDGVGVAVAAVLPGMAVLLVAAVVPGTAVPTDVAAAPTVLAFAGSVWVVLAGSAVLLLVAVFAEGAFVLGPSSALLTSLVVASTCACCAAVSWG